MASRGVEMYEDEDMFGNKKTNRNPLVLCGMLLNRFCSSSLWWIPRYTREFRHL